MNSETDEKILERLICPICFTHPQKEVFQCQNGHPICSSCISKLDFGSVGKCPHCQSSFGMPRIRCRVMESLLDIVKLPCENRDAGCKQRFFRKELPDHHKTCGFRSVSLCKWIGHDCNFAASNVESMIKHLESCHGAKKWVGAVWKQFEKECEPNTPVAPFCTLFLREFAGFGDGEPQQVQVEKVWILFICKLSVEPTLQRFVSIVPILLHDIRTTPEHEVNIEVFVDNDQSKRVVSKWSGFPSNYKDAQEDILYPSFRLNTNYIMKQAPECSPLTKFDLRFHVSVTGKPIQTEENHSQRIRIFPITFGGKVQK